METKSGVIFSSFYQNYKKVQVSIYDGSHLHKKIRDLAVLKEIFRKYFKIS